MILDSSFLIDLLRGRKDAAAKARRMDHAGVPMRLSAAAWYELHEGVARADRPVDERWRIDALREVLLPLPVKFEHAARAGEVSGNLARKGRVIGDVDALLAGQGLVEDEPVVTRDERDFRLVEGLRIETY